jgi:hypothetical protein
VIAQHTPGPWFIETHKSPNCYPSVTIRSTDKSEWGNPKWICDMPDQTGEEPADFDQKLRKSYYDDPKIASENLANARLIASAPDMFEALQAIADACGDRDTLLIDQCKAALAKAKGEA